MKTGCAPHWTSREAPFVPPRRREDIIEDELDGEAILHDPRSGDTFRFNETSLDVWQSCDGSLSTRQIALQLVDRYDEVDLDSALDHVEQLIVVLCQSGLLDLRDYP